jgi:hypothetical protein
LATSPFPNYFSCPKQEPRFIFEIKLLPKLSIYKTIGHTKWCDPTILQTYILLTFINGFQTPLRKLVKRDVYVSISFENIYKSFTPLFKTLSNFTMA